MTFYDRYFTECALNSIDPCSQSTAEALGVTKATITKWKTNGNTPNGDTVAKAARLLGVSTDYLLGNDGRKLVYVPLVDSQCNEINELFQEKISESNDDEQFIIHQLKLDSNIFYRLKNCTGFGIPLFDLLLVADRFGVRDQILDIISPQTRGSDLPDRFRRNINSIVFNKNGNEHTVAILTDGQVSAISGYLSGEEQELLRKFRSLDEPGKRSVNQIAQNELDRVNQYGYMESKIISKEAK